MQQETFVVGGREFTCLPMNAFEANRIALRLQKLIVPVMGSLVGTGKNIGDVNVGVAAGVIAEHLDEGIMEAIALPMLKEARVYCVEQKKFLDSPTAINLCFTTETLFDFYELLFLVGRYQFGPFLARFMERFGAQLAARQTT